MDFVVGLPETKRTKFNSIVVFVDRLTKMVHACPCRNTVTAEQTADLLFDNVVRLHGMPKTIVSDRGTQFTGAFLPALLKRLGTQQSLSTAFHPQTDGQTERMNRVLGETLRSFADHDPSQWDRYLTAAEFAINNSHSRSTGRSPFFLNYGFHPRTPLNLELVAHVPAATNYADTLAVRLDAAKRFLQAAQSRMVADENRHRRPVTFAVGQQVLLSTRNLSTQRGQRKLMPKWIGPFPIEAVVNPAAMRLTLPDTYRIHNVFHVSLLKPYRADLGANPPPPLFSDEFSDDQPVWDVEKILDDRCRKTRNRSLCEYLVKWLNRGHEHDEWVPADRIDPAMVAAYQATKRREDTDA